MRRRVEDRSSAVGDSRTFKELSSRDPGGRRRVTGPVRVEVGLLPEMSGSSSPRLPGEVRFENGVPPKRSSKEGQKSVTTVQSRRRCHRSKPVQDGERRRVSGRGRRLTEDAWVYRRSVGQDRLEDAGPTRGRRTAGDIWVGDDIPPKKSGSRRRTATYVQVEDEGLPEKSGPSTECRRKGPGRKRTTVWEVRVLHESSR